MTTNFFHTVFFEKKTPEKSLRLLVVGRKFIYFWVHTFLSIALKQKSKLNKCKLNLSELNKTFFFFFRWRMIQYLCCVVCTFASRLWQLYMKCMAISFSTFLFIFISRRTHWQARSCHYIRKRQAHGYVHAYKHLSHTVFHRMRIITIIISRLSIHLR